MRPVGFGVLGCGGMGRWHARQILDLPALDLVAMADPSEAARGKSERPFTVPVFADAAEVLALGAVEVVSICTPPATHAALAEAAAHAGKHVLIEKPFALDLAEADRAIAGCAARGVQLGVVHQQRAQSACRTLHRLLAEGRLGRPLLAIAAHGWFRRQEDLAAHVWRGTDPGGALLLDQAIHAIDLLLWLLGPPAWVSAATGSHVLRGGGEDTAVALIGFGSGALATLAASTGADLARDDTAIELYGTRGGCRLEIRDYDHAEISRLDLADAAGARARALSRAAIEAEIRRDDGGWRAGPRSLPWRMLARLAGAERGTHPFRSPRAFLRRQADRVAQRERGEPQAHALVLAQMARAVREGEPPLVTGADARRSLAVIEAIRRSHAAGGGPVTLDALLAA